MNVKREELIASLIATAFSLAYLIYAFFIPMPPLKQQLGPGAFPKGVGVVMLILSGIYVLQQVRGGVKEDEERAAIIGAEEKIQGKVNLKRIGFILVLMVFYALVFERLGYAISTFVVFIAGVFYLDRRHLVRDGLIAVISSFVLYYVFTTILRVQLPAGPLKWLGL
ncbi:MAG: tripartite tricarboxylate transporter TctB family protein [Thermodesulfobacteriota bacterium]